VQQLQRRSRAVVVVVVAFAVAVAVAVDVAVAVAESCCPQLISGSLVTVVIVSGESGCSGRNSGIDNFLHNISRLSLLPLLPRWMPLPSLRQSVLSGALGVCGTGIQQVRQIFGPW
jgi:hypothetical protein